jgi:hypothetical protein
VWWAGRVSTMAGIWGGSGSRSRPWPQKGVIEGLRAQRRRSWSEMSSSGGHLTLVPVRLALVATLGTSRLLGPAAQRPCSRLQCIISLDIATMLP